jgi:hypothetical membrane protein
MCFTCGGFFFFFFFKFLILGERESWGVWILVWLVGMFPVAGLWLRSHMCFWLGSAGERRERFHVVVVVVVVVAVTVKAAMEGKRGKFGRVGKEEASF